eukprot:TRINITY_DN3080_c0_g1_i1.p1 TRINITY_DN3080_c0_g1~~TRINITY_DN3080_c0_g1_i1.p1  ORF type:complete len:751 (-),score=267.60 TRINITY_DN3080_c0_g1_i1:467-2719(-)
MKISEIFFFFDSLPKMSDYLKNEEDEYNKLINDIHDNFVFEIDEKHLNENEDPKEGENVDNNNTNNNNEENNNILDNEKKKSTSIFSSVPRIAESREETDDLFKNLLQKQEEFIDHVENTNEDEEIKNVPINEDNQDNDSNEDKVINENEPITKENKEIEKEKEKNNYIKRAYLERNSLEEVSDSSDSDDSADDVKDSNTIQTTPPTQNKTEEISINDIQIEENKIDYEDPIERIDEKNEIISDNNTTIETNTIDQNSNEKDKRDSGPLVFDDDTTLTGDLHDNNKSFNVLLLGTNGSGKSSVIEYSKKFQNGPHLINYKHNLYFVKMIEKHLKTSDPKDISEKSQISALLALYQIDSKDSWEKIKNFIDRLFDLEKVWPQVICFIGTFSDRESDREVDRKVVKQYIRDKQITHSHVTELSCSDVHTLEEAIKKTVKCILKAEEDRLIVGSVFDTENKENKENIVENTNPEKLSSKQRLAPRKDVLSKWYRPIIKEKSNESEPTINSDLIIDIEKMRDAVNGIKIGEKKIMTKKKKRTVNDAFSASDGLAWAIKNLNKERTVAVSLMTNLLKRGFLINLSSTKLIYRDKDTYKWRLDEKSPPHNMNVIYNDVAEPFPFVSNLFEEILRIISMNLKFHNNSMGVHHENMNNISLDFAKFQKSVCRLANINLKELKGKDLKISFWVNVYNILLLHSLTKTTTPPNNSKSTFFPEQLLLDWRRVLLFERDLPRHFERKHKKQPSWNPCLCTRR